MKILKLTIKNFLGITEAVISPGKITPLAGKNGQGKTSILKAIEALFKGAPLSVIHQGTERAEIVAEMEDILVSRVWTHKTTSVSVKDSRNFVRPAPQGFLDGLFGNFAFNPLAFLLSEPKKRREILLKAMDVTATKEAIVADAGEDIPLPPSGPALEMYGEAHKFFYSRRTDVNRRLKQKRAAAEEVQKKLPEGYKPVEGIEQKGLAIQQLLSGVRSGISALEADKKAAERAKETRTKTEDRIRKNQGILESAKVTLAEEKIPDIAGLRKNVESLRLQMRAAEEALQAGTAIVANMDRLRGDISAMERDIRQDQETLTALPGAFDESLLAAEMKNHDDLQTEAATIEAERSRQRIWNEYAILRDEAGEAFEESERLTGLVDLFGDILPAKALHEAKLPIPGLALSDEKITVDGKPLDDLSTSEQMSVTMAIAKSLAGELKVICIDGAERLDEKTRAEFIRQAEGDDFYYFVTRVGEPKPGEIEVKEGRVA